MGQATPPPQQGWTRVPGLLTLLAGALFIILALAGASTLVLMLRSSALTEAERNLQQIGAALAEQTARSFQAVDVVLQDAAHRIEVAAASAGVDPAAAMASERVNRMLRERLQSAPQLVAISLVDSRGRMVNSTRSFPAPPIDLADRDYVQALGAQPWTEPAITAPVRSKVTGAWIVMVVRPLDMLGGDFKGVVGVLPLRTIEASYGAVAKEPGTVVTLMRNDGVVLARFPSDETVIGRPKDSQDPNLLVAHRALHTQPLAIEVTRTMDAALAGWRRQALAIAALVLPACLAVGMLLAALARRLRARMEDRQSLAERNRELEEARVRLERQASELAQTADALREGEKLLAERSATLDTTLQFMDQGILMVDASGRVAAYNHRVVEMLGIPDELLSRQPQFREVLQFQWETGEFSRTGQTLREFVRAGGMLDRPQVYSRERPDGRTIEVRSLPLPGGGIVRTYTDITERKHAEALVERAALFDELTGLPNRLSLRQELERRLREAPSGAGLALFCLNLDRFRLVNDARGYEAGDRLLGEVGRRIKATTGSDDFVSRTGGDEFAVLHAFDMDQEAVSALGERLLQVLAEPHVINGVRLAVTASIGVAVATEDATTDTLLRNADIAMYRAKDSGRNQVCRYAPAMAAAQQERFQLEQALREALGTPAFRLEYQPIVSLETDAIAGYEALVRWTDRARGEVSPGRFIPVAEATGLIVPLGRFVLETACFEAARWRNACTVAVNLSPVQFQGDHLLDLVEDVLQRSGLSPDRLELEVTEGVLLEDTGAVHETMLALRELGVSLTLDDFGTGHAGLSYLRRFPFDKMKIDRSFICNLGQDQGSDAIVEAILLLGQRLGMRVVAEGVEEQSQLDQLRRMRCPYVQGYLTGRPVAAEIARAL